MSRLDGRAVCDSEKALGLIHVKPTDGVRLRNWLTYKLREQILDFERAGYYSSGAVSLRLFRIKFNRSVAEEIERFMRAGWRSSKRKWATIMFFLTKYRMANIALRKS